MHAHFGILAYLRFKNKLQVIQNKIIWFVLNTDSRTHVGSHVRPFYSGKFHTVIWNCLGKVCVPLFIKSKVLERTPLDIMVVCLFV